jgi:hypothetical protein
MRYLPSFARHRAIKTLLTRARVQAARTSRLFVSRQRHRLKGSASSQPQDCHRRLIFSCSQWPLPALHELEIGYANAASYA